MSLLGSIFLIRKHIVLVATVPLKGILSFKATKYLIQHPKI